MNKIVKLGLVGSGLLVLGGLVMVLQRHNITPKPTWKPVQIELNQHSVQVEGYQALVHISGEVRRPGVYAVSPNVRLKEVLQVAGGVTPRANLDKLNLAKRVNDGMKIHVGSRKQVKKKEAKKQRSLQIVSINTAPTSQLVTVKGIGPKMAERIVT